MTSDTPRLFPIKVPELGTGSETVRVSAWLVDVGQKVVAGDHVVEVLLPGMTFDIDADETGELLEIVKPVDSTVSPGEVVGWIEI